MEVHIKERAYFEKAFKKAFGHVNYREFRKDVEHALTRQSQAIEPVITEEDLTVMDLRLLSMFVDFIDMKDVKVWEGKWGRNPLTVWPVACYMWEVDPALRVVYWKRYSGVGDVPELDLARMQWELARSGDYWVPRRLPDKSLTDMTVTVFDVKLTLPAGVCAMDVPGYPELVATHGHPSMLDREGYDRPGLKEIMEAAISAVNTQASAT